MLLESQPSGRRHLGAPAAVAEAGIAPAKCRTAQDIDLTSTMPVDPMEVLKNDIRVEFMQFAGS